MDDTVSISGAHDQPNANDSLFVGPCGSSSPALLSDWRALRRNDRAAFKSQRVRHPSVGSLRFWESRTVELSRAFAAQFLPGCTQVPVSELAVASRSGSGVV